MKHTTASGILVASLCCWGIGGCDVLSNDQSSETGPVAGATHENAIVLVVGAQSLTKGSIGAGEQRWYYFTAQKDSSYLLYIDDGSPSASGTYTCWLSKPEVYRPDILAANAYTLDGRGFYPDEPYQFTAVDSEEVYIKLTPGSSTGSGTFGIRIGNAN